MQTAIRVDERHLNALRNLAISLGLFQTRGVGTGELPSVSAAVRLLAELSEDQEFIDFVLELRTRKGVG